MPDGERRKPIDIEVCRSKALSIHIEVCRTKVKVATSKNRKKKILCLFPHDYRTYNGNTLVMTEC
jgi:hypothetical protein